MKEQSYNSIYQEFDQQVYFAEQLNQIQQQYIPTSYGQVYSMTAGSKGQPLILIVHGSGPNNNCKQYQPLLHQYLVRISYTEKFYLVTIDCPGYGKSIGSKQAIKTFPLQLFTEILVSLGYNQYFAMMGNSQGGAAIFNACYQNPNLTEFMLMDRPVCGNIQRFRKFSIPTLLVYDIEDDGHPIWQGKLLYKQLANSELYTFRSSQNPYWIHDNLWDKILKFFSKNSKGNKRKNKLNFLEGQRAISIQTKTNKNNSLSKKNQIKTKEVKKQLKNLQLKVLNSKKQSSSSSIQYLSEQKKFKAYSLDSKKQNNYYKKVQYQKNNQKLQQIKQAQKQELLSICSKNLSQEQKLQMKEMEQQMRLKQEEFLKDQKKSYEKKYSQFEKQKEVNIKTKSYEIQVKIESDQNIKNKIQQEEGKCKSPNKQNDILSIMNKDNLKTENKQFICAICYQHYYRPMQTNCQHIFCTKCLIQSLLVNSKCPLCRTEVTKKTQKKQLQQKILSLMSSQQIKNREKAYLKLKLMLDSIVYIEIGNRSMQLQTKKSAFTKTKKKYNWEIFVRQKPNFKFQQVSFNINMGNNESKPIKIKNAPFVFQSRSTFSFTCQINIKPRSNEYSPLTVVYRINVQPGVHTKKIALKKKIYQNK